MIPMNTRHALAALAAPTLMAVSLAMVAPALAAPAQADDAAPRRMAVSYADLNLDTGDGQAVLTARIHRAAEAVCGPEPDSRDVKALMAFDGCMQQSVGAAVSAIPHARRVAGSAKPAG
jgi:UrcA family protein